MDPDKTKKESSSSAHTYVAGPQLASLVEVGYLSGDFTVSLLSSCRDPGAGWSRSTKEQEKHVRPLETQTYCQFPPVLVARAGHVAGLSLLLCNEL